MPAPAFLALNKRVAIVCLAGEREIPHHKPTTSNSWRAETDGKNAGSPVRGQKLPPSLWASTHTSSPGSVQALLGGGLGGRRSDREADSRNECLGAGVWPEEGNWGLLPNDMCDCAVPRPARGARGAESGGRAVRVLVERAALVFRAMDESKVWGLLKGRELLVVGHGLGGGTAHLLTVQALSSLQHPLLCRTFYSLALGPCLPSGLCLSVAEFCHFLDPEVVLVATVVARGSVCTVASVHVSRMRFDGRCLGGIPRWHPPPLITHGVLARHRRNRSR